MSSKSKYLRTEYFTYQLECCVQNQFTKLSTSLDSHKKF